MRTEHLRSQGYPDLQIDSWPEDDHPGQSVVEAIAGSVAIEHTSVDTLPEQRRIGEQFMEALAILELLPVEARLSIVVPYELVTVGSDWEAYRLALAHWIVEVSSTRCWRPFGKVSARCRTDSISCGLRRRAERSSSTSQSRLELDPTNSTEAAIIPRPRVPAR